jgi:uncharacterized protein YndB with AHSA1/START domain
MSAKEREGQQDQEITEIRKTIIIDATPEVVFKAITDPNELTHWFPDQAILEPKVGGRMKFSFFKTDSQYRQMDYFPEGIISEFVPNKKISYTWQEPNIPDFPKTIGHGNLRGLIMIKQDLDCCILDLVLMR